MEKINQTEKHTGFSGWEFKRGINSPLLAKQLLLQQVLYRISIKSLGNKTSSATNKAKKTDHDLRNVHDLGKLQKVIEKMNSIEEDIFCLTEIKKKSHGTAMLSQFMLA
ncbi:hypothetical protein HN011_009387 [Eciton burchellii]|nr:hypothetical protein HN011_009387 [Eciton burchellii]